MVASQLLLSYLRQGFSVLQLWLPWNLLCRLDWPQTHRELCLPSDGIKSMSHYRTPTFLHGFWDMNSDPHACMAITFTLPALQPLSCLRDKGTESRNQYKPAHCSLLSFTVASTHRLRTIEMKFCKGILCSQCPCQAPFHQVSAGSNLVTGDIEAISSL